VQNNPQLAVPTASCGKERQWYGFFTEFGQTKKRTMKRQMSRITGLAFLMALFLVSLTKIAVAQNNLTWDNLGTKQVDYALDRDVFEANSKNTYSALKFKVNNGAVNIHKVTVHYANGDSQDVKLPANMSKDNDGQVIDLKGNQRVIDKITFWYDTKDGSKTKEKAVVEVWAKK
jgi:hypothetical protein